MVPAADGRPWFHAAVQLLDLRAKDRVLALASTDHEAQALARLVGGRGAVTIVYADRHTAEAVADHVPAHVEVAVRLLDGDERFGSFDALLAAPTHGPLPRPIALGRLARHNLRPGGRCVVDVPAPEMLPELAGAALELGWPDGDLIHLRGIADDELAAAMQEAGLRGVHSLLATHLLHLGSPMDLVDLFAAALPVSPDQRIELAHAITRRRGSPAELDALVHRSRLQAQR